MLGTMGRFKDALLMWVSTPTRRELQKMALKKEESTTKAAVESAVVRMWKRNSQELESLLTTAYEKINTQAEIIANAKQGDWQEKLIDKGLELAPLFFGNQGKFIPKPPTHAPAPLQVETKTSSSIVNAATNPPEAALNLTSTEIKEYVDNVPENYVKPLTNLTYDRFVKIIKNKVPELNNEQILEAHGYMHERLNNGEIRQESAESSTKGKTTGEEGNTAK